MEVPIKNWQCVNMRKSVALTQKELAIKLNISRRTVINEEAKTFPSKYFCYALYGVFTTTKHKETKGGRG